jgi:hypothetical protein
LDVIEQAAILEPRNTPIVAPATGGQTETNQPVPAQQGEAMK